MTVETRKLEWLMVNQDESAVHGRQQRLESCLVEGCHIHPRSPLSSKSIRKASIEKHNLFGRGRLLQERPRDEAGGIQCCQEMLTDSPTNFQIGLTPDIPCAAKIRRPQGRVPKSVKRVFRALAPEPDPLESSGYVLKGMEDKLRLEIQ